MDGRLRTKGLAFILTIVTAPFWLNGSLHGQVSTGSVAGRVSDSATRRALASAQVFIPGTTRGALTDQNGEFVLVNVSPGAATLRVRIVGYGDQEVEVIVSAGETVRTDFQLSQTAISLDEIVVTGTPGGATRRSLGNAISTINAAEIVERAPITNVNDLLMARTPGLTLMPGAGTVGTSASVRIRGAGSLNAGNFPVFYIDGVRFTTNQRGSLGVSGQSRNPLDHLNPDDIESIEVIKGPAASTLYGAEAAAGVIQVITKKGRTGQPNLSWGAKFEYGSIDWPWEHPTNYLICGEEQINLPNDWPGCVGMDPTAPAAQRLLSDNRLRDDPGALRDGTLERFGLNARGGGERYSFYASFDRDKELGVFYNNDFRRTAGRVNFQATVLDNVDISFSSGYARSTSRLPLNDNASNGLLRNAYRGRPGRNDPWQPGYLGLGSEIINEYDNGLDGERLTLSSTTNVKPFSWLTNRLTIGLDLNSGLAETYTRIDTTGRSPWGVTVANGQADRISSKDYQYTVDFASTASHQLNEDFGSAFSVGGQLNVNRYRELRAIGRGFVSDNLNLISAAAITTSAETKSEQNSVGIYVQEQVSWKDRLFVTGALRVDDNSAFGEDFTIAVYPKFQASWIVSEEPFFNLDLFDEVKLRGAFGRAGNAPTPFSADRNYNSTVTTYVDGTTQNALTTSAYGNPDLKAETGHEFEIGADAGMLAGRLGLELTYYNQRTKDALITVPVPPSSGFTGNQLQNIGEIANSGFELALWGTPINTPNVSWEVRGTLATNSNKLISLGGREPIKFGSFDQVQAHIPGYSLAGYWYTETLRDASGQPILDSQGRAQLAPDTTFLGPSAPTREIGLSNTLRLFGNIELYAFTDYKGGYWMWSAQEFVRSTLDQNSFRVNDPNLSEIERNAFINGGNRPYFERADFIKLREVSLSYHLPGRFANRFGVKTATLTASGRNLAIWTKYGLGPDPELNFSGDNSLTRSEYMSVPMLRRFVGSVSFTF